MFFCNSMATEKSWFGSGTLYNNSMLDSRLHHCTLYNSIDVKKIGRSAWKVDREKVKKNLDISRRPIVGVVARLRSEKGHSFLFHAMKRVTQSMPRAVLVIIGDGPDKSSLEALAEELHLIENVRWLGSIPHEETFHSMELWMSLLCLHSMRDSVSAAAEAMAAGVPVVATDVGGLREVVDRNSTGFLVPYDDARRLREAILRLLRDDTLAQKMGTEGEKRSPDYFHCQPLKLQCRLSITGIVANLNGKRRADIRGHASLQQRQ